MVYMYRFYLLLISILLSQTLWSQNYLPVERFTNQSGLTDNAITCLYEDYMGFIWVGTHNGLNRYNGYSFEHFKPDLSNHESLPASKILKLFEDPENKLWVLTNKALSRFDYRDKTFRNYFIRQDQEANLPPVELKDATLNWKENLVLILGEDRLNLLDINTGEKREITLQGTLPQNTMKSFKSVRYNGLNDTYYLFSDRDVFQYLPREDSLQAVPLDNKAILLGDGGIRGSVCGADGICWLFSSAHIWQLKEGMFHLLWEVSFLQGERILNLDQSTSGVLRITTTSAMISLNLETGERATQFTYSYPLTETLKLNTSLRLKSGIFLLGTSGGLFQYNEYEQAFGSLDIHAFLGRDAQLASLCYDAADQLWLVSESGQIAVLKRDTDLQIYDRIASGRLNAAIYFMRTPRKKDTVFLATDKGLYQLIRQNKTIRSRNLFPGRIKAMSKIEQDSVTFVCGDSLLIMSQAGNFRMQSNKINVLKIDTVLDMFRQSSSIFMLQPHQLVKYNLLTTETQLLSLAGLGLSAIPRNTCFLASNNREIIVGTTMGMYIFYSSDFKVLPSYIDLDLRNAHITTMLQDSDQKLWFSSEKGLFSLNRTEDQLISYTAREGHSFPATGYTGAAMNSGTEICFAAPASVTTYRTDTQMNISPPRVRIESLELISRQGSENISLLELDTLRLKSKFTLLRFYCNVLDFWHPDLNYFQYSLTELGHTEEWSNISRDNKIDIAHLKAGEYLLQVRGANSRHIWSNEPDEIIIQIMAPFWQTKLAIITYVALVILTFYFSLFFTTRHLRKLNREYRERELIAKKVVQQKEELTQKNKNITDSINYAKRIQMALMPSQRLFGKIFPDSFILHIPKDIVSGDFYWINEVDGRIYFAAVDCTGHGVPGAFMSIIGFELFRRITEIEKKKRPAEVLNSLSMGFETIFRDIEDITLRDGMDVAFCAIDPEMKVLEFAGAFNPLYLIRDNTISEIKGDRFSVGLNQNEDGTISQEFLDHVIQLKDGDILYIFTDGYADQFGGPEGKKYKYRRFRHLLLALHQLPMDRQVEFLRRSIMDWKGDLDQVDDILVMGIRINQKKDKKKT